MYEILNQLKLDIPNNGDTVYWEAGGQKSFRIKYLEKPKHFFKDFDEIIFIIDVQDILRYEESLNFFNSILGILLEMRIFPHLNFFIHKFDPGIELLDEFSDEKIKVLLIKKIREMVPLDFNFQIYKTSIFTVFRKEMVLKMTIAQ